MAEERRTARGDILSCCGTAAAYKCPPPARPTIPTNSWGTPRPLLASTLTQLFRTGLNRKRKAAGFSPPPLLVLHFSSLSLTVFSESENSIKPKLVRPKSRLFPSDFPFFHAQPEERTFSPRNFLISFLRSPLHANIWRLNEVRDGK